jgi:ATP-dependent DNA helicase RecG
MLGTEELSQRLTDLEADNVERTRAGRDRKKITEAICAFANDLPNRRDTGVLFIGANDDGTCAELAIENDLVTAIADYAHNGTIAPLPLMTVRVLHVLGCRLIVVEVQPSENPPVKYEGRVCVRRGPQRGYATAEEERRLVEKRRWGLLPFDQQPVAGTSLADLDMLRFQLEYLPADVAPDVLIENHRDPIDQLRAQRFLSPDERATAAGLLLVGKDPEAWLPGAYVQFLRYPGEAIGEVIRDEKRIGGVLADQFRYLDDIISANIEQRADLSGSRQRVFPTYPQIAIQELVRNAIIHRTYEGTATPVRLTWFDNRIEITSPGGPYGQVTRENFGTGGATDYRNPALAAAAKALNFAQRFGSGIPRARLALTRNGNSPPVFRVEPQFVHVTIQAAVP